MTTARHDIESTFRIQPADLELYAPGDGHRRVVPRLDLTLNRVQGRWEIQLILEVDDLRKPEHDAAGDVVLFTAKDEPDLGRLGEAFATLFARLEDGTPLPALGHSPPAATPRTTGGSRP